MVTLGWPKSFDLVLMRISMAATPVSPVVGLPTKTRVSHRGGGWHSYSSAAPHAKWLVRVRTWPTRGGSSRR
jgi:hypothetical protein